MSAPQEAQQMAPMVSGCHLATVHSEDIGPVPEDYGFTVTVEGREIPGTLAHFVCDECGEPCDLIEIPDGRL